MNVHARCLIHQIAGQVWQQGHGHIVVGRDGEGTLRIPRVEGDGVERLFKLRQRAADRNLKLKRAGGRAHAVRPAYEQVVLHQVTQPVERVGDSRLRHADLAARACGVPLIHYGIKNNQKI